MVEEEKDRVQKALPEWATDRIAPILELSKTQSVYVDDLVKIFLDRRRFIALADFCGTLVEALQQQFDEAKEQQDQEEVRPESCRECRFWKVDASMDQGWNGGSGYCRVVSPVVIGVGIYGIQRDRQWPMTAGDDWCGEFEWSRNQRQESEL